MCKQVKNIFLLLFVAVSMTAVAQTQRYVGGDISMLPEYEKHNSGYLNQNGQKIADLLDWLVDDCNWNTFRVRIFVNPTNPNGDGVLQTTAYVKELGKRIKDKGAYFMLDFHYSDTWVDATHIQAPAAWTSFEGMPDSVANYTRRTLDALIAYGAQPDLVQVGNEIMYGVCGIKVHPYDAAGDNWSLYSEVLKAGCNAVREKCPQAKIIIHTDRPTNTEYNRYYYQKLVDLGVDFDVIGLSYYPFWHGYLTSEQVAAKSNKNHLAQALSQLAVDFPNKEVQLVETAYNFQYWPTSGVNYNTQDVWECSRKGQYEFVRDLVAEMKQHDNVTGICYWFPEEAGNGDDTDWNVSKGTVLRTWLNRGLWDENWSGKGHALNTTGVRKLDAAHELGSFAPKVTMLVETSAEAKAQRVLHNGTVVIIRGNRNYGIDGRSL